jgi:hypothetical protein
VCGCGRRCYCWRRGPAHYALCVATESHNVRADTASLWAPGILRARGRGTSLAAVVRASVRAYLAGEIDDVVDRWLPVDASDGEGSAGAEAGPQTLHLPFPA